MAAFTRFLFVIFLLGLVYEAASSQQCNGPRQLPNHGKMLKRHIYETRKARSGHAECLFVCREKNVCQSFNFVIAKSVCEFNNRTKEASPKDFVDDSDRYYVKLDVSRVPLGSISELPAKSCKEINDNEGQKMADGKYWFHSLIPGKSVLAPCDMVNEDIDECNASPKVCTNGDCRNFIGSYDCSNCKSGFAGNGKSCNDVNECVSNPCKNGATCINTHGSYQCNCTSNFTGTHCDQDVNECSVSNPCKNGAACTNTHGGYQCTCSSGFTGKHCHKDIDECAGDSHDCDVNAYCTNTKGSFSCSCKPEYHGDGKRCVYARGLNESAILSNDSRYVKNLTSYLEPVVQSSSHSRFVRCWHAKNDGWASTTFKSKCGYHYPTVTIIQVGSYIFGGYIDSYWYSGSQCTYVSSSKAFIFSLHNIKGSTPVKLEIKPSHYHTAAYRCSGYGPIFGSAHDIYISNDAANNKDSYINCGHTYPLPPGYSSSGQCAFYAGSFYNFSPTDIEVFYETTT